MLSKKQINISVCLYLRTSVVTYKSQYSAQCVSLGDFCALLSFKHVSSFQCGLKYSIAMRLHDPLKYVVFILIQCRPWFTGNRFHRI